MSARITVHCIGNAHIDPVWRWPWQEGYAETLATCRAALDRLDESDDFIFSRGQAATYAWVEEADPGMFMEIYEYIREGRWHIINGWWEQPDCNIPCGESYVRHALYGKRWFREKFGVDVTVGWNPDTFGHNTDLPQILAKCGFRTYVFFRPGRHEKELPGPYFWWQGPDGSRVLAIRAPVGHYATSGGSMADQVREAAEKAREMGLEHTILFYGVGNHGGGPTIENINSIRALRDDPDEPNAVFSTVEAFAEAVADKYDTFPVVADDLQHHAPGCYSTQSEIKRLNRQAENRLLRAERWCAIAAWARDRPYDATGFAHAWHLVLFNQFHDILAGTSLPAAYDHAREQIGEACAIAARYQNEALQALAAHIDTTSDETEPPAAAKGRPILLFNPSSWERSDPVTVQWGWRGKNTGRIVDDIGEEVPFQFTQPDVFGQGMRVHFEATIPANGYRVYRLLQEDPVTTSLIAKANPPPIPVVPAPSQGETSSSPTSFAPLPITEPGLGTGKAENDTPAPPSSGEERAAMEPRAGFGHLPYTLHPTPYTLPGGPWLENAHWRLEFDADIGCLTRLLDKARGVEVLDGPGCALLVIDDPGDTWGHDIASWRDEIGRFAEAVVRVTEEGPSRVTLTVNTKWGNSTARQEFTLYRESPRIDVRLTVDWHERHKMLKLSVPVGVRNGVLTYEAPYSTIVRAADGKEDPGQNWIDLAGEATGAGNIAYGVALLNDCKYGFDCLGSDLRMTILRSPIYCFHDPAVPEPDREYHYIDQGTQTIRYALLPHAGDWRDGNVPQQGFALNNPFEYVFQYPHRGELGRAGAMLAVEPSNVVAGALKVAEDESGLVLRLFETNGAATKATVVLPDGNTIQTPMNAWELKTLLLPSDGSVHDVGLLEE